MSPRLVTAVASLAAFLLVETAHAQAFADSQPVNIPSSTSPLDVERNEKGYCLADVSGIEPDRAEGKARLACINYLIPKQPSPVLSTPGAFFIGYAWGSRSKQFVYGPQVGVSGAIQFPIRRVFLERVRDINGKMAFRLPRSMSSTFDFSVSLTANFASFTFPNQDAATADTQQTFNIGFYAAPEFGWAWWSDDGKGHKVAVALGVMGGLINTEATGTAFALGFQPALLAHF